MLPTLYRVGKYCVLRSCRLFGESVGTVLPLHHRGSLVYDVRQEERLSLPYSENEERDVYER